MIILLDMDTHTHFYTVAINYQLYKLNPFSCAGRRCFTPRAVSCNHKCFSLQNNNNNNDTFLKELEKQKSAN